MNRVAWESIENKLLRTVGEYCEDSEIALLQRAIDFGAKAHGEQKRASGEPYFTHPLTVAYYVAQIHMPIDGVIAAVLHDVLEDCEEDCDFVSEDELEKLFGRRVVQLVVGVSKLKDSKIPSRQHTDALTLRRMVRFAADDPLVFIIKIADRLHNIHTLDAVPREKQSRIAKQTQQLYVPIAQRLGLYQWAEVLEERCFKVRRPKTYSIIEDAMQKRFSTQRSKRAFKKLVQNVEEALKEEGIEAVVRSRTKRISAIYRKLRKSDRRHLDQITDIYGVRVVVKDRPSCYQALGAIHAHFRPKLDQLKDYIAVPKPNNYQSLHTKISHEVLDIVDIQIRSRKMDDVAATGIAAHWRNNSEWEKNYSRFLQQLSEFEFTDRIAEYSDNISDALQSDIRVYTPKNHMVDLPAGATALDFAYNIHTDVGRSAEVAYINGRKSSIFTELNPGDMVKIQTSRLVNPTREWLEYVTSARARNALKVQLSKQSSLKLRNTGRKLIRAELRKYKVAAFNLSRKDRQNIADLHHVKDWRELVYRVGRGEIDVKKLVKEVVTSKGFVDASPEKIGTKIVLDTEPGGEFYSCRECLPVPGDDVVGLMVPDRGIVVHEYQCEFYKEGLNNKFEKIQTTWGDIEDILFPAGLTVETKNKPRVLAEIASAIADKNSNIGTVTVHERDQFNSEIYFKLMVRDRDHLADIIRSLRNIEVVLGITRNRIKPKSSTI